MNKILAVVALVIFIGIHGAFGEIIQTSNLTPIESAIQKADSDTLVIFDVDDVLMHPYDQILTVQNKPYLEELEKGLEKRLGETNANLLYSLIFIQRHNGPVDRKIIDLIVNLQKKGAKVLALTNCFTGKFGAIDSMENWRINELMRIGYDFEKSWSGLESQRFEGLSKKGNGLSAKSGSEPIFKKGVIFASSASKGDTLKAFLAYAAFVPKKIVFIDDKKKNLKSVETLAAELGIPFVGIEYTAIKDSKIEPLNKERAQYQFEVLEKEHKWLSDEEADAREQTARKKHEQ